MVSDEASGLGVIGDSGSLQHVILIDADTVARRAILRFSSADAGQNPWSRHGTWKSPSLPAPAAGGGSRGLVGFRGSIDADGGSTQEASWFAFMGRRIHIHHGSNRGVPSRT